MKTATEFRRNLYQWLDEVAETGAPLLIQKGAHTFVIRVKEPPRKLERLISRDLFAGDPDELIQEESGP